MSDHIPFDIQSEIIKNLPVKSLIQFRSVSKQWKSLIDSSEFIRNYHIDHANPQHHLLVERRLRNDVRTYTSIVDDNTFPQQKYPLTAPESLNSLRHTYIPKSVNGLLCFLGDVGLNDLMAVIWNPSIRKSVSIVIPNAFPFGCGYTVIGFGVCPDDTSDPKLVRINVNEMKPYTWVVEVFTLSTRVWKTVYNGAPFKSCDFTWNNVCIDGIIYWRTNVLDEGLLSNYIISFDLKREQFGEVSLSEGLALTNNLRVAKVNNSLRLLEYYKEGEIWVCGVWTRRDGVNKPFTKIYKVEGKYLLNRVLGFRNNGEVVLAMDDDNDGYNLEVYEPSSRHINGVGINIKYGLSAVSYTETLILLNEQNSIIHG